MTEGVLPLCICLVFFSSLLGAGICAVAMRRTMSFTVKCPGCKKKLVIHPMSKQAFCALDQLNPPKL